MSNKKFYYFIILLILIILSLTFIIGNYKYNEYKEEKIKNTKYYSQVDKNFYLQNGRLFVIDDNDNVIEVPGNFSQMNISDYDGENHQSKKNVGEICFHYKLDDKIYLIMSGNGWRTIELTSKEIGMLSDAKIKYMRISGSFGYIFYVNSNGDGKILKSTTEGNYWSEVKTDFAINDNSELKFLNKYGMTVDGFLTVPSEDFEKCDLYRVDNFSEKTFEKVSVNLDDDIDYYTMPTYVDDFGMVLSMDVRKNIHDSNFNKFISGDNGITWKIENEYLAHKKEEKDKNNEWLNNFNNSVENLDSNIFLKDFEGYNISSNEIKISEERAKKIAEKGFKESASRIAGEEIEDTEKENITIKDVWANNYFTRKYNQGDEVYTNLKRKAYVVTKENELGNGVMIYVDVTTGLIIGGSAFGD